MVSKQKGLNEIVDGLDKLRDRIASYAEEICLE